MKGELIRKNAGRLLLQIAATVLALAILAYFAYHVWRMSTSEVTTKTAVPVTVESVVDADAYIFRTEQLINARSNAGGTVTSVLSDGEKVGVKGTVAKIYGTYAPEIVARLEAIEDQIELLEDSSSGTQSLKYIASLDRDIQDLLVDLRYKSVTKDYSAVASVRRSLLTDNNKREIIIGHIGDLENEVALLRDEIASLTRQLGSLLETVLAPAGGYWYSSVDGFENIFTPDLLEKLTVSSFEDLTQNTPAPISPQCVGKLVTEYGWDFACSVDKATAEAMKEGNVYRVGFPYNHDIRLDMTLTRIVTEEGTDSSVLVFHSEQMLSGFEYTRTQPVEIVVTEYVGFEIPADSIRIVDGEMGVYVLNGSKVCFRKIRTVAIVDSVYIAAAAPEEDPGAYPWLARNDIIILTGKGLYDGRILT